MKRCLRETTQAPFCLSMSKKAPRSGAPERGAFSVSVVAHEQAHHGLLGVEPVLGLLKDLVGVGLKDLGGDLLSPVGGQTVLHHGTRVGQSHELIIDLVDPLEG